MSGKKWVLINQSMNHYEESLTVTPFDFSSHRPMISGWSVTKQRLSGGRQDGVDAILVDNGEIRFTVLPTRGMGLWKAWCDDLEIGWKSPVPGPVHPAFVNLYEPSGIGWLSGFDELLVRAGLGSNGAPEFDANGILRYPLHGKIQNTPANYCELSVDSERGEIEITGVVEESRMFGNNLRLRTTYTTRLGEPWIRVVDVIENISSVPAEFELLYHINFGLPLLEAGAKAVLPVKRMAPRNAIAADPVRYRQWETYESPTPGIAEVCYLCDLYATEEGRTSVMLHDAAAKRGVQISFSRDQLPLFTLWKNPVAETDGYVTGLEPSINFPNTRSFEKQQGRVATLAPGQSRLFELKLSILSNEDAVSAAKRDILAISEGKPVEFLPQPDPRWSE